MKAGPRPTPLKTWKDLGHTQYAVTRRGYRRCTPVEQVDLETGLVLATFASQNDAMRATGISQNMICKCVNGYVPMAGGFGWRFVRNDASEERTKMTPSEAKEVAKKRRMKGLVDELISAKEEAEAREALAELSLEELQQLRKEMK